MIDVIVLLFGLAIGSFLNVLIDRLPQNENIVWKPSHCDYCKKTLRWYELFPVISFLIQNGRCRRCRNALSVQYPLIELITAAGIVFIMRSFYASPVLTVVTAIVYCVLLVIFMIDWKLQIIPDGMLIVFLFATVVVLFRLPVSLRTEHFVNGLIVGGFFLALWLGTRGRGIGFGDVKMSFIMGAFLGHPGTVVAFYTAFLTGAMVGVILMITRRAKLKTKIAFGPFLILGFWVGHVFGDTIWRVWLTLL